MESTFRRLWTLGPAAFVVKVIIAAIVADALLLGFILLRRMYRRRYFARRDRRVFEFRQKWEQLLSGDIPYDAWRLDNFDRQIVEDIVLDAFEAANPVESARLLGFMRKTGLIEKRIFEARHYRGWQRMAALVALGRTRAPEGISALAEGLRDKHQETRHAALRGLARTASPEAAGEILTWVGERGLQAPALLIQNALINCCREAPRMLLPYLEHADREVREMLARVLGEIPVNSIENALIALAEDDLPEMRAAAARALSNAGHGQAVEALAELAKDPVWFVRLRAVVALGKIYDARAIRPLLQALTDSNRLVRMRAAEGLVDRKSELASIFAEAVAAQDRYGLYAYFAALENAGLRKQLEAQLQEQAAGGDSNAANLLATLAAGELKAPPPAPLLSGPEQPLAPAPAAMAPK
ncbi:MAG TPA: HEAT repeat domain-containing protein [Candidatus Aquilonibacter sp.]|nr:HEAT repeat domain-containing protein [Candidatus Aquilonibacter sp.]